MKVNTTHLNQPGTETFALRLKRSTRKVHSMAEQTTFIRGFLRGTADLHSYLQLLTDFLHVYTRMESEWERLLQTGEPALSQFTFRELFRSKTLLKDIAFILDHQIGLSYPTPTSAASDYAKRIQEVSRGQEPHRLIGHLYTRYMGDLSGGQILAKIAHKSLGLDAGAGLDFYEFKEIPDISVAKDAFRTAMNQSVDGLKEKENAVTDEAIRAFRYNIQIFETLSGSAWKTLLRNLPGCSHRIQPKAA
ncbi:MAG: biliverdin-producing heme oxygenase [Verrucomicrobiota bacterium]